MPDPVLTLLKYVFLAVLYLFFLRVLRAVWVEMREPRPGSVPSTAATADTAAVPAVPARTARSVPDKLVVVSPPQYKGEEFPIGEELTVGRAGGCAVLLEHDSFVSQLHARLFRRNGEVFVEDLGSTNGTFLNGRKVTSAVSLRKGDKIQFGRTTLEMRK